MPSTADEVNLEYKHAFRELADHYGGAHLIPPRDIDRISERLRARFVLLAHPGENTKVILNKYAISATVAAEVAEIDTLEIERQQRRADKWKTIIAWCADHVGWQTSAREIAEIGGFSESTASKFINDRVDLFRKIRKGIYEVRSRETELAVGP